MTKSIWQKRKNNYPVLQEDLKTEILIIGGGLCGLLCAYYLTQSGHQVVVLEADEIGSHRTGKTTAVITALQDGYYSELAEMIGKEKARLFLDANLNAIEEYKKLSQELIFDFEEVSSFKYSSDLKRLEKEVLFLSQLGYFAPLVSNFKHFGIVGNAIEFLNQGQMNPILLIDELAKKCKIYEHTRVQKIKDKIAYTEKYKIEADKIVIATGYPFFKFHGGLFMKLTQNKSFVCAIKTPEKTKGNAIGGLAKDMYFRSYRDYLIIGANDQKTGQFKKSYETLHYYVKKNYPNVPIEYQWVNQDCVSLDGMPYIGRYRFLKNVFVATGFNLWGMTGSMISAQLIRDLIENKTNPYQSLFSIYRPMLFVPLLTNMGTAVFNIIKPKKPRCTHLGCALKWNEEEHCYECPCHGSKYDEFGNILESPGNHSINIK